MPIFLLREIYIHEDNANMENVYVYLDGGYLSKIARYFFPGKYPDYCIKQFANTLAKSKGLWCKKAFFYIGEPYQSPNHPSENDIERKKRHNVFIKRIEKIPDLVVRQGRCQKDGKGGYHQKGVDTWLTMDLLSLQNREDNINKVIVLICDTDFVPILEELRNKYGIKIIVAYYSDFKRGSGFSMSNHLWNVADDKILIDKGYFEKSLRK
jgi:uncharacterized LabA/DUF88 family protein